MPYFKKLKITTHDGAEIELNGNGDVDSGYYDILNWHMGDAGEITFVKVGEYKYTSTKSELVLPKNSSLFWNTESSMVSCSDIYCLL